MPGRKSKEDEARIAKALAEAASGQGWEIPDPGEVIVAKPDDNFLKWAQQLGEFSDQAKHRNEGFLSRVFAQRDEVDAFTRKFRAALQYLNRSLKVAGPVQRTDGAWLVQYKAGKVKAEAPAEAPAEQASAEQPANIQPVS